MTEKLRDEFTRKMKLARDCCQLLSTHQPLIQNKVDIEKIMEALAIFDEIDTYLSEGDPVIKQHIQLMDFLIKKLKEKMMEYGVVE